MDHELIRAPQRRDIRMFVLTGFSNNSYFQTIMSTLHVKCPCDKRDFIMDVAVKGHLIF